MSPTSNLNVNMHYASVKEPTEDNTIDEDSEDSEPQRYIHLTRHEIEEIDGDYASDSWIYIDDPRHPDYPEYYKENYVTYLSSSDSDSSSKQGRVKCNICNKAFAKKMSRNKHENKAHGYNRQQINMAKKYSENSSTEEEVLECKHCSKGGCNNNVVEELGSPKKH